MVEHSFGYLLLRYENLFMPKAFQFFFFFFEF